jgi:hypothetical protein
MTIRNLYPDIKPTLSLNFAKVKALDPRITFTRASSATYIDGQGIWKQATNNQARFDHDPVTGESLGLLIEEQRTNLLLRSEEFNDAAWLKSEATIDPNSVVSPSGLLDADTLIATTTVANHFTRPSTLIAAVDGNVFTASYYVKSAGALRCRLSFEGTTWVGGVQPVTNFNLSNTTVYGQTASVSSASIVPVGNGWFRVSITTFAAVGSFNTRIAIWIANPDGSNSGFAGDGTSGIYIWGAQLEVGAFATSYIQTVASQVTRSADAASMTGTNFSSWFGGAPNGSVYVEASSYGLVGASANDRRHYFSLSDTATGASGPNFFFVYGVTNGVGTVVRSNGDTVTTTAGSGVTSLSNGQAVKYATSYTFDTISRATNSTLGTDISRLVTSGQFSRLTVGAQSDGIRVLNGTIKKLAFYPQRLTNTQLQALTK